MCMQDELNSEVSETPLAANTAADDTAAAPGEEAEEQEAPEASKSSVGGGVQLDQTVDTGRQHIIKVCRTTTDDLGK